MNDIKNQFFLIVTKGPHKGEKFPLSNKNIIGRDDEADIKLDKDGRISRQHMIIIYTDNKFYIKNLSKSNKLLINKKEVNEARIIDTDKIKVGVSELQLYIHKAKTTTRTKQVNNIIRKKVTHQKNIIKPISFVLIMLVICGFFLMSTNEKSTDQHEIASEISNENSETNIGAKDQVHARKFKIKKKDQGTILAQSQYVIGFRDFKKGQYARAIIHLANCLNYQPNHVLCNRYLALSQKKIEEMIQYQIITGRKFLDQKQYKACTSSFRNIAFLMQSKSDPRYKEAIENEKFCKEMLKESF